MKKMHSMPVVFGATVQFRHKLSGQFLTFSRGQSDSDPTAMKVSIAALILRRLLILLVYRLDSPPQAAQPHYAGSMWHTVVI